MYFHYDLYVSLINQVQTIIVYWVSLVIITRTTYGIHLKLRRKLEGLAYENAENQNLWRTTRPRIGPLAYVYALFKQLNGSIGSLSNILSIFIAAKRLYGTAFVPVERRSV